jgi:hypothetical protein
MVQSRSFSSISGHIAQNGITTWQEQLRACITLLFVDLQTACHRKLLMKLLSADNDCSLNPVL